MNSERTSNHHYGEAFLAEIRKKGELYVYFYHDEYELLLKAETQSQFEDALLSTRCYHLKVDKDPVTTFKRLKSLKPHRVGLSEFEIAIRRNPVSPDDKFHYGKEFMKACEKHPDKDQIFKLGLWNLFEGAVTKERFAAILRHSSFHKVYIYPDPRDTWVELVAGYEVRVFDEAPVFDCLVEIPVIGVVVKIIVVIMVTNKKSAYAKKCKRLRRVKG